MTEARSDRPEQPADAAMEALSAYRARTEPEERGIECLLARAPVAEDEAETRRRRIELVGWAVDEAGIPQEFADQVYDIAREEGIEPAFAFELVRCGVAICLPADTPPDVASSVRGRPDWVEGDVPPEQAERERKLRLSFRRLRSLIDECGSPEQALERFAREPDVDACGY